MRKKACTVIAAALILTLAALSVIFGGPKLTENQFSTLKILAIVCGCSVAYCFVVGQITQNFSQMDKLWSILPVAYVWIIAARGGLKLRLVIYAVIVTVWGIRLTVNFARKGAYSIKFWEGNEDYRWSIVRKNPVFRSNIAWALFNLLFISLYQNVLVLAICLPSLACMESAAATGICDLVAALGSIAFLILETVADEYQWRFHQTKKKMVAADGLLDGAAMPYSLGFNTTGPWGYMRHPNYLGEQGFWLCLYIFVIAAGVVEKGIFNWSFVGPLFLVLLFMGSSALGEAISSGKYPQYGNYVKQVFKYLPLRRFDPNR